MPRISEVIKQKSLRFFKARLAYNDARKELEGVLKGVSPEQMMDLLLEAVDIPSPFLAAAGLPTNAKTRKANASYEEQKSLPPRGGRKAARRTKKAARKASTKSASGPKSRRVAKSTGVPVPTTGRLRDRLLIAFSHGKATTDEVHARVDSKLHRPSIITAVSQLKTERCISAVDKQKSERGGNEVSVWSLTPKGFSEFNKLVITPAAKAASKTKGKTGKPVVNSESSLREKIVTVLTENDGKSMKATDIVGVLRDLGVKGTAHFDQNIRNVLTRNDKVFARDRAKGRGFWKLRAQKKTGRGATVTPIRPNVSVDEQPRNENAAVG